MTTDFDTMTSSEIENVVDAGLRHKTGIVPRDYLMHWLYIARHFAYATYDDSWGEFEKEFAIIIKRLVVAERDNKRLKKALDEVCNAATEQLLKGKIT